MYKKICSFHSYFLLILLLNLTNGCSTDLKWDEIEKVTRDANNSVTIMLHSGKKIFLDLVSVIPELNMVVYRNRETQEEIRCIGDGGCTTITSPSKFTISDNNILIKLSNVAFRILSEGLGRDIIKIVISESIKRV